MGIREGIKDIREGASKTREGASKVASSAPAEITSRLAEVPSGVSGRVRNVADRAIGAALNSPIPVPETVASALEQAQPSQRDRQKHLEIYRGRIGLVGSFSEDRPKKETAAMAAETAKILFSSGVITRKGVVGIRAMMPSTVLEEEGMILADSLNESAKKLEKAITKEGGNATFLNDVPLAVPPGATRDNPQGAYDAINEGLGELEEHLYGLEKRAKKASPKATGHASLIVVADPNFAAGIFPPLMTEKRLDEGEVVALTAVNGLAKHTYWTLLGHRREERRIPRAPLELNPTIELL